MALAHDNGTLSATFTTTSPFAFDHTPSGTPRGVAVFIIHNTVSTDLITGVTYGGETMARIQLGQRTSAGEEGCAYAYFLGSSIPTGTQSVSITHTGAASVKIAACVTVTAATDTVIADSENLTATVNTTNPSVVLDTGATTALRYCALYSGLQDVNTSSVIADMSAITGLILDVAGWGARVDRQTTPSSGSFTIGYTAAVDDAAMAAIAIAESGVTPITASVTSDLNVASDSLAAFRPMSAGLSTDNWGNLADELLVNLTSDNVPLTFTGESNLNTWTDSPSRLVESILLRPTDDAANLSDSLQITRVGGWQDLLAFDLAELVETTPINASLGPDALGLGTDALAASMPMSADLADNVANLDDSFAALAARLADLADSAANLNDALAAARALFVDLSDSAANLNDPQPRLVEDHFLALPDDLNAWGDGVAADLTEGFAALTANLTDSAANLADSLAGLEDLRAALADDGANLSDALTYIQGLLADLSDSAANLLDTLEAFESLRADLSDDTANLADSLAVITAGFGELLVSLPLDSMANADDSVAGFMNFAALATDDAANLNDLLGLIKGQYLSLPDDLNQWSDALITLRGLLAQLIDATTDLLDSLSGAEDLRADLADSADNLADLLAGHRAMFADLSDDANNLDDLLSFFESGLAALTANFPPDQMGNFADSLSGVRQLFAALAADDAANLADSLDSLRVLIADLPADAMGNLADLLAATASGFLDLLVSLPADQMGNFTDTLGRVEGLLVALDSDDAANLADSFDALRGLIVALSDDESNLSDALGRFLDLYANLADPYALTDALAIFVGGLELIGTVTLSNGLAHSLTVTETLISGSATLSDAGVGSLIVTEAPADA